MSWHEIRRRAGRFSKRWQGRESLGERSDTHTFYNEFFEIFGKDRSSVATYEKRVYIKDNEDSPQGMLWEDPEPVSTKDNGNKHPKYTDLLWPGVLLIEHKSPGENLHEAYEQAMGRYAKNLPDDQRPRYIMISDFYNFRLYDETGEGLIKSFRLSELPQHVKEFSFMVNFNITPNLQGKQICDTDGAPMSGPILRAVRNNARWLLLVSWAVGLACGLGLSPITDYLGEVSSPSHGSH